jgi:hypothetical protein
MEMTNEVVFWLTVARPAQIYEGSTNAKGPNIQYISSETYSSTKLDTHGSREGNRDQRWLPVRIL